MSGFFYCIFYPGIKVDKCEAFYLVDYSDNYSITIFYLLYRKQVTAEH